MIKKKKQKMSYTRMIAVGFAALIFLGAIFLTLPIATRSGEGMRFLDALFTATSATCVTGLVIADTYTNWTLFGQLVILTLIQIGGLGFITIGVYVAVILKKKIGLKSREAIHESVSTMETAGAVRLTKKIIQGTLLLELIGAIILSVKFIPSFGFVKGFYFGIFHSISAFCNAGFDLMGYWEPYSSFVGYEGDLLINGVVMILITIGGIGFIVWDDLIRNGLHFKKYLLHTKIVLTTSAFLVFGGAVLFWFFERNNLFVDMTLKETILGALFSSVTARTAGFNTVDTASLSPSSQMLTIMLMFIGGSPGSTAGGIKTTTIFVLFISAVSMIKQSYGVNVFGRRLYQDAVKRASTVFFINLSLALFAITILLSLEPFSMSEIMFEVFSAIGTVGMSTGITRDLHEASKMVIIVLMYCGRLGSLSFALVFAQRKVIAPVQYPEEKMIVG